MNRAWILQLGKTTAVLVTLLLLLFGGLSWGLSAVRRATAPKPLPACVTTPATSLLPAQVTVRIFNGGSITGLAATVGSALRGKGFNVTRTTNTEEHISETIIVGARADNPEVLLVLGQFEKALVRVDGRTDGTVDVLVGDAYGGIAKTPPTAVPVPAGSVCLPSPTGTPKATPTAVLATAVTPTPTPTPTKASKATKTSTKR